MSKVTLFVFGVIVALCGLVFVGSHTVGDWLASMLTFGPLGAVVVMSTEVVGNIHKGIKPKELKTIQGLVVEIATSQDKANKVLAANSAQIFAFYEGAYADACIAAGLMKAGDEPSLLGFAMLIDGSVPTHRETDPQKGPGYRQNSVYQAVLSAIQREKQKRSVIKAQAEWDKQYEANKQTIAKANPTMDAAQVEALAKQATGQRAEELSPTDHRDRIISTLLAAIEDYVGSLGHGKVRTAFYQLVAREKFKTKFADGLWEMAAGMREQHGDVVKVLSTHVTAADLGDLSKQPREKQIGPQTTQTAQPAPAQTTTVQPAPATSDETKAGVEEAQAEERRAASPKAGKRGKASQTA